MRRILTVPETNPVQTRWHVAANAAEWLGQALSRLAAAETEALAARGVFHIVLAGGGTPRRLYQALAGEAHDWSRWQVWFGDERCLPVGDPERNSTLASEAWLERVAMPAENIHAIPAELGARAGAEAYVLELAASTGLQGTQPTSALPRTPSLRTGEGARFVDMFDLVLLGLGEDGHTASLFPGRDPGAGTAAPDVLAVFDAPKPPPERISLSARRLSRAHRVLFLATGAGKREAIAAWRSGLPIPAAAIRPDVGVDVLIDRDAFPEGD
jgi:6-phosphogluconolactonase